MLHSDLLAGYPRGGELFDEAFSAAGQLLGPVLQTLKLPDGEGDSEEAAPTTRRPRLGHPDSRAGAVGPSQAQKLIGACPIIPLAIFLSLWRQIMAV